MMRHPVVITSLEEDFRSLGLIVPVGAIGGRSMGEDEETSEEPPNQGMAPTSHADAHDYAHDHGYPQFNGMGGVDGGPHHAGTGDPRHAGQTGSDTTDTTSAGDHRGAMPGEANLPETGREAMTAKKKTEKKIPLKGMPANGRMGATEAKDEQPNEDEDAGHAGERGGG